MKRDENRPRLIAGTARLDHKPKKPTRAATLKQHRQIAAWQEKETKGNTKK